MSRRGYLALKNRDGSTVVVNLDTMEMSGYRRPDSLGARRNNQERIERRRRDMEALQADLDAESSPSKDGCFGVVLMLLIGAATVVTMAIQVVA